MKRLYCILPLITGLLMLPVFGGFVLLVYAIEALSGQRRHIGATAALRVCDGIYYVLTTLIMKAWRNA